MNDNITLNSNSGSGRTTSIGPLNPGHSLNGQPDGFLESLRETDTAEVSFVLSDDVVRLTPDSISVTDLYEKSKDSIHDLCDDTPRCYRFTHLRVGPTPEVVSEPSNYDRTRPELVIHTDRGDWLVQGLGWDQPILDPWHNPDGVTFRLWPSKISRVQHTPQTSPDGETWNAEFVRG